MSKKLQDDTECVSAWREITSRFNKLIVGDPEPNKIKKELLALKDEAKQNSLLNYRQSDAIIGRVDNYLSGIYGGKSYTANEYDKSRMAGKKQ